MSSSVQLEFVPRSFGPAVQRAIIATAAVVVIDTGELSPGGAGAMLVPLCVRAGIPIILLHALDEGSLDGALAALSIDSVDIVFDPFDPVERLRNAIAISTERQWAMRLAHELGPELRALPTDFGRLCFAVICGGSATNSVASFHRFLGASSTTNSRRLAEAGIPSARNLVVGARLALALDALRHPGDVSDIASSYGFGTVRTLRRALSDFADTTVDEVRDGLPGQVIVDRLALKARCGEDRRSIIMTEKRRF